MSMICQGLKRSVSLNPDAIATICDGRKRTFRELFQRVQKLAGALRKLGLQSGDRVAMWGLNSDRYLEYFLAVGWAGGVFVPVNYRWSNAEVLFSLNDSAPSILLVDEQFCTAAEAIRDEAKSLREWIYVGDGTAPQGFYSYEELLDAAEPVEETVVALTDLAGIFYTGGTTGVPKGVMLSHLNLWSSAMGQAVEGWFPPGSIFLHIAPMFHLADFAATHALLIKGGTHSFQAIFEPASVLERIGEDQVTDLLIVPTMLQMLVDHPGFENYDLGSVRHFIYGASPMHAGLLDRILSIMPDVKFTQAYGMTELSPVCSILSPEYHTGEGIKLGKLRSVGRPNSIAEVRIVDPDGNEVERGTVGEIIVTGPTVMLGYWNRPQETAKALINGWMHTGDGGYMDQDGFIFLVDRLKDMIISGGENVYSAEVEIAISKHPAVAQSAVIGLPHEKWVETVHAVIVLKPGLTATEEEIVSHCRELIAGYKCPRSVDFVDAMPMSGAGKIMKNKLRELQEQK